MTTQIKSEIKKIAKRNGSHIGVIKHIITNSNPEINFEDYREFANQQLNNKFSNTKSTIKATIRYQ